ncbi:MAG: RNA polymerase sigma factor [Acidobacteriota bacterium]
MSNVEPDNQAARHALHDEWLVVRCQLGERDAFDPLIARWHPALSRYASRVGGDGDRTGDIVQDIWLRVLRGLPGLRDPSKFRPWLFGIARRVLMDRLRLRYSEPRFEDVDTSLLPEPVVDDRHEDLSAMETGLATLPPIEREVLDLFYLQELSLLEIADVTAVPVGTVKSRLHRARHLLRRQLAEKGIRP